ncbi:MAG TPA: T9SS type A sorting domain-containing protein [Flavipsychrobacter sp.]|nr:T9SS type A sorting domain-containing protein [Flavipsychrobacter sp.]
MKNILFILLSCLAFINADAQSWNLARSSLHVGEDQGRDVAVDGNGNIYTTGYFKGVLTLDTFTLVSKGKSDIFIMKHNAVGDFQWVKSIGGFQEDESYAIAGDGDNSVYICGYFTDSLQYSGGTAYSKGLRDILYVKYDSTGSLIWLKTAGTPYWDVAWDIDIDSADNVYIVGDFSTSNVGADTIYFDGIKLVAWNASTAFLLKYNKQGNIIWAKQIHDGYASSVTSNNGNIVVSGVFSKTITFSGILTLHSTSNGLVNANVFLAQYDSSGNILWAKTISAENTIGGNSWATMGGSRTTIAPDGSIYLIGGYYYCRLKFETAPWLQNFADFDVYLIKYSPTGVVQWGRRCGWYGTDSPGGVVADSSGVYISGSFNVKGIFENDTIQGAGSNDVFIVKYDHNGNKQWVKTAGGSGYETASSLARDPTGNLYIAGYFSSSALHFGGDMLTHAGSSDMFFARLSTNPTIVPTVLPDYQVAIYPNPASDVVTVTAPGIIKAVAIYNYTGKEVFNSQLTGNHRKIIINTEEFPNGLYLVRITTQNGSTTKKLVIQH